MEQWISSALLENGICTPGDLFDLEWVAEAFDVKLLFSDSPSFSDNELRVIFINKHLDDIIVRLIFFHELCHVLRHAGDQRYMPELFEEAQEYEADAFVLYATMPFYMFSQLSIPQSKGEAVPFVADVFNVSLDLADQRLEQIFRREMQGDWLLNIVAKN
ncbi:ImmA/IrrE family metallo-endopeptidase [Paenibacillus lentus]|uniref:ImmA/IrrE family metallo-endopeptidase n=1 Tax=Paenibacillus lentus TaxID=1338368 RepID=UPI001FE3723E|nr:ImmA/IrrE family metallo-endopeptidase [Paenibacillus lentus]